MTSTYLEKLGPYIYPKPHSIFRLLYRKLILSKSVLGDCQIHENFSKQLFLEKKNYHLKMQSKHTINFGLQFIFITC